MTADEAGSAGNESFQAFAMSAEERAPLLGQLHAGQRSAPAPRHGAAQTEYRRQTNAAHELHDGRSKVSRCGQGAGQKAVNPRQIHSTKTAGPVREIRKLLCVLEDRNRLAMTQQR